MSSKHKTSSKTSSVSCSGNGSSSSSGNVSVKISDGIVSVTINQITQKYNGTKCKVSNGRVKIDGIVQSHDGAK